MPIQQNNLQQQAIAANLAAAERVSDTNKESVVKEARDTRVNTSESVVKQALNGATGNKAGTQLLAALFTKLGDSFSTDKILGKYDRESAVPEGKEDYNDTVNIKLPSNKINRAQKGTGERSGGEDGEGQRQPEVREYLKTYTQFLANGGSELKKQIERQDGSLVESGKVKVGELMKLRADVAKSVRQEVLKQVKAAFQKEIFAQGKIEQMIAHNGVIRAADWVTLNERIGAQEFGGYDQNLKGAITEAGEQVKDEINSYMKDELARTVTKKLIAEGDEAAKVEKELGDLLKIASKCGFNIDNFMQNASRMVNDLGLVPIFGNDLAAQAQMGQDGGQGERREYQYTEEEEKDVLMERMRALYMQRAISGDWRGNLDVSFKMIRTRNGLVKLGIKMEDFSRLEKEGRQLAKLKLIQMLEEGFGERASYAKLQGAAWTMTEKKIKNVLRNLAKLGVELDDKDLEAIRDKMNDRVFAEVEHELQMMDGALQARDSNYLRQKRKTALQILGRISQESNIPWNYDKIKSVEVAT
ncbi:MAG: hypothetical protein KKF06_04185 [Candidatus Margulisbacteria bacterium]|nr:hypothetical protein [Candidatus Margulisiibacteriota bacterium]